MNDSRRGPRSREAMEAIKNYILTNHLSPGDPLPTETAMCQSLGVSRSSVREAISNLSALDIVEVRHGHGTFVSSVSMEPMVQQLVFRGILDPGSDFRVLTEIVEVRQALDMAFAPAVTQEWKGKRSAELHEAVDRMKVRAIQGKTFPADDRFFHSHLIAPLGNNLFCQLTEAFWDVHTTIQPHLGVPDATDMEVTAQAHGDMLKAAEKGDEDAYREAVIAHYAPLLRNLKAT